MRVIATLVCVPLMGCFAGVAPMIGADKKGSFVGVEVRAGSGLLAGAAGVSSESDGPVGFYGRVDAGLLTNGLSDDSPSPIGRLGGGLYKSDVLHGMFVVGAGGGLSGPLCSNRDSGPAYGAELQVRYVGHWQVALAPYLHYVSNNVGCF